MLNALTIDVEDYFHVTAFEPYVSNLEWKYMPSRVEHNIFRILDILRGFDIKATFFVLGWVAENNPSLIREICKEGHEIACHGYGHKLVYKITPDEFRKDVRKAKQIIEDAIGDRIRGFRATSFSFIESSLWALDILIEEGFSYDSSIFPVRHDRYGIHYWNRFPHLISRDAGDICELPPSTVRFLGNNMPVAGGAYLRFLPLSFLTRGINRLNNTELKPAVIYLHPWELDAGQLRINTGMITGLRHYSRLDTVEGKIRKLLSSFEFGRASDLIRGNLAVN